MIFSRDPKDKNSQSGNNYSPGPDSYNANISMIKINNPKFKFS